MIPLVKRIYVEENSNSNVILLEADKLKHDKSHNKLIERELYELLHNLSFLTQKLSFLTQSNPLAVVEWNTAFEVVEWNAAAERIFGYSKNEALGRHLLDLVVSEENRKLTHEYFQSLFEQADKAENILENRTKDSKTITCNWYTTAIKNPEALVVGGFAIVQDINDMTACHRTEEILQEQTNLSQLILDSMSDGVAVADEEGRLLVLNPSAVQMFGDGITNKDHEEWSEHYGLFLPDQTTPFPADQLPLIRTIQGEEPKDVEIFVRHAQAPDGLWVIISGKPMRDSSGALKAGVVVCRDITERKHVEQALQQRTQELEQALKELQHTQAQLIQNEKMSSLGQLVAGVAHEINNPVNFINGNLTHADEYTQSLLHLLDVYQEYYPNPPAEIEDQIEAIDLDYLKIDMPKLFSSMKMGADRIRQIVSSLRTFSRMDEAEFKTVDIHEGIDSTLLILQHRLKAKHDRPEIEIIKEYGEIPPIECYAGQLNQVFMNILSNAIDALDERNNRQIAQNMPLLPNKISIRTEIFAPGLLKISISDNGLGMTEEVRKRLFDPFFTTKALGKGTGLGLSISYQVVTEKHGGSLQCISSPGQGAEFIIILPTVH